MAAISKHLFPNDPYRPRVTRTSLSQYLHEFCERLAANDPSLTELYLGGRALGDTGAKELAAVLPGNTVLRVLYLCYNNIGNVGATAVADALQRNTSVEILRLEGNRIGDEVGAALRDTLKVNRTLKKLYLYKNVIGPYGCAALADGLQYNECLEVLDLYGNHVGNDGAMSFGISLQLSYQKLKELNLGANSIGFEGARALVEGLAHNSSLTVLDLRLNEIGIAGARAISNMLVMNQELKRLWLQNNELGTGGAAIVVKDGLKHNYFLERLFLGHIDDRPLNMELDFYLKLNRAGRRLLRMDKEVPCAVWAHVLAQVKNEPDMIYYFLKGIPHLFKT